MKVRYQINGHVYAFDKVQVKDGQVRGYCYKVGNWANLYPGFVRFDGEKMIPAETISCPFWG